MILVSKKESTDDLSTDESLTSDVYATRSLTPTIVNKVYSEEYIWYGMLIELTTKLKLEKITVYDSSTQQNITYIKIIETRTDWDSDDPMGDGWGISLYKIDGLVVQAGDEYPSGSKTPINDSFVKYTNYAWSNGYYSRSYTPTNYTQAVEGLIVGYGMYEAQYTIIVEEQMYPFNDPITHTQDVFNKHIVSYGAIQ